MVPPSDDKGAAFEIAPTRHILGYKFALRDSKNSEFLPQIRKEANCRKAICYLLKIICIIIHKLLCFEKVLPISFNGHQLFCKIYFLWPFDI